MTAIYRAYRLITDENNRVIDELDTLLGPTRAEQLVSDRRDASLGAIGRTPIKGGPPTPETH